LHVNLRPTEEFKPLTSAELDEALEELGSPAKEAPLRAAKRLALARPDPARRDEMVAALKPLLTHKDVLTRAAGVRAFGAWAGKDSVPAVVKSLKDKNSVVRRAAMEALGKLRDERGADAVARLLLSDGDRFDAGNSLRAMGAIAEKSVRKVLKNDERRVKVEVCGILKAIGTRESLGSLTFVAEHETDVVVARAALEAVKAIRARP
jgi:HEAT repeat protein